MIQQLKSNYLVLTIKLYGCLLNESAFFVWIDQHTIIYGSKYEVWHQTGFNLTEIK